MLVLWGSEASSLFLRDERGVAVTDFWPRRSGPVKQECQSGSSKGRRLWGNALFFTHHVLFKDKVLKPSNPSFCFVDSRPQFQAGGGSFESLRLNFRACVPVPRGFCLAVGIPKPKSTTQRLSAIQRSIFIEKIKALKQVKHLTQIPKESFASSGFIPLTLDHCQKVHLSISLVEPPIGISKVFCLFTYSFLSNSEIWWENKSHTSHFETRTLNLTNQEVRGTGQKATRQEDPCLSWIFNFWTRSKANWTAEVQEC